MKFISALGAAVLFASTASAACYGSRNFQNCYDSDSGNSYTINRMGNSTHMNGYNSQTGSSWSQDSYTNGNNTQHYGRDSRGNNWSTNCINGRCY